MYANVNIVEEICGHSLVKDEVFGEIQFVFSGVLVLIIGACGLVGNILTCLTLKMMAKAMTPFNKLLLTLAIFDMMFILLGGTFMTKSAFG